MPELGERDRSWHVCLIVCCALVIAPLWATDVPPLVDLPQHAAQIAIAHAWDDSAAHYPETYAVNYLNNTIVSYALVYVFAFALPVLVAFKVVLSLALLAIVFATLRLIRAVEGNRWWVFVIFPVTYGYAFMWGFVNFVIALPMALMMIDAAIRYRAGPTRRRAIILGAWTTAAFLTHILVVAYGGLAALLVVWFGMRGRERWVGVIALAVVVPVAAAWFTATTLLTPSSIPTGTPTVLDYGVHRVSGLFGSMLGHSPNSMTLIIGGLVLALPWLLGSRLTREAWRGMPLAASLLCHFLMPMSLNATAFVAPRFAFFVAPAMLLVIVPTERERRIVRIPIVLVAIGWLVSVTLRFHAFGVESQTPLQLLAKAQPHGRILSLIDNPHSSAVEGAPYLHVGMWYQVERGGIADFSFAEFFPNRFRYRPEADPPLPSNIEWHPGLFDWNKHGGDRYDYFLIRAPNPTQYFNGAKYPLRVVAGGQDGWWLVHQIRP